MEISLTTGIFMGVAILVLVILFFFPLIAGRRNVQHRILTSIYNIYDFVCLLFLEPRTTAFLSTVQILQSFRTAHKASKIWLGHCYARKLRPSLKTCKTSLLPLHGIPLHRMSSQHHRRSQALSPGVPRSFIDLPFDIRVMVYQQYLRLFPRPRWNITDTLKADPNFLDAMAFIRTCKLIREELGLRMFQTLKFETDTKYPFYQSLPASLTREIRNLSLLFRPSTDVAFIHHILIRQLHRMRALSNVTLTVTERVLVDLDLEFEYILRLFKIAHPTLNSLAVTTSVTLATPTAELALSQAMTRLVASLMPSFGVHPAFRTSVWARDVGKGRFRPATGWFCRIAAGNDPEWEELPDEAE